MNISTLIKNKNHPFFHDNSNAAAFENTINIMQNFFENEFEKYYRKHVLSHSRKPSAYSNCNETLRTFNHSNYKSTNIYLNQLITSTILMETAVLKTLFLQESENS